MDVREGLAIDTLRRVLKAVLAGLAGLITGWALAGTSYAGPLPW